MEITTHDAGDFLEVHAKGRLDGSWTTHFSTTLDEIVRQGHHRLRVNLSEVTYISSMGVGVLVECYKNLLAIQGVLVVSKPSAVVRKVLDMVDLSATLMAEPTSKPRSRSTSPEFTAIERGEARFEIYTLDGDGVMCRLIGNPSLLAGCGFSEASCKLVTFDNDAFGVGLGAFGSSFADCKERFGEFLAVAGAAAYQPGDGSNAPDFMLGGTTKFPEVQTLYGVVSEGSFSRMARFTSLQAEDPVSLTSLAEAALDLVDADAAWIVIVAESAGLAGVSLRKSPVAGACAGAPFEHPEVRNWLSFTTERAHVRALVVATGVVARPGVEDLDTVTRPLSRGAKVVGHVHAAAFSYRPLPQDLIELDDTIRAVFEKEVILGVLHLIGDDRESTRVSESEFVRGAMWVAPISAFAPTGSRTPGTSLNLPDPPRTSPNLHK
ncbi:MAG: STAS domain-containing protein [Vicinamibacterales bacterium]